MSTLLSFPFWFNLRPGSMGVLPRNIFIGVIIIFIVLAIIFFIKKKKKGLYHHLTSNLYDFCISNAFISLLLLFFNYEVVPFFSAHFWFLLWILVSAWWLFNLLKELKKITTRKKQQGQLDEIKKYLP